MKLLLISQKWNERGILKLKHKLCNFDNENFVNNIILILEHIKSGIIYIIFFRNYKILKYVKYL